MDLYEAIKMERGEQWNFGYDSDDIEETESEREDQDPNEESENEHSKLIEEIMTDKKAFTDEEKPWYIISKNATWRIYWDVFIILMAILNVAVIPLDLAFGDLIKIEDDAPINRNKPGHVRMDELNTVIAYISMVVFLIDIVINSFTSYLNVATGDEVYSLGKILANYAFGGSFLPDIASTFPLKIWVAPTDPGVKICLGILGVLKV
jgi:hypothetical protein